MRDNTMGGIGSIWGGAILLRYVVGRGIH